MTLDHVFNADPIGRESSCLFFPSLESLSRWIGSGEITWSDVMTSVLSLCFVYGKTRSCVIIACFCVPDKIAIFISQEKEDFYFTSLCLFYCSTIILHILLNYVEWASNIVFKEFFLRTVP